MGLIYAIMALLQGLMQVLYWALVLGVPGLLLWKLWQNRRRPFWLVIWAALAVVWMLPMAVEYTRDRMLAKWVTTLPAAPVLMLPPEARLALESGTLNPDTGRAQFSECAGREYDSPLCDFSLGAELAVQGHSLALLGPEGAQHLDWQHAPDCDFYQPTDNTLPDPLVAYLTAQGICLRAAAPTAPGVTLAYHSAPIPGFPGQTYGQIIATTPSQSSTLTAFRLDRPVFPALWGLHWLPVLAGLLPQKTNDLRFGQPMGEATIAGLPPGSLQALVYAQGWGIGPAYDPDMQAVLAQRFPYQPERALPALRSGGFFPTRYAIELVCAPGFRASITPETVAELRNIATQSTVIGNDYPRQLAQQALADGCGKGL